MKKDLTRRSFLQGGCAAAVGVAAWTGGWLTPAEAAVHGPVQHVLPLDHDWRFGASTSRAALLPRFDERGFRSVSLPHCVAELSWQNWNPDEWQRTWVYRRRFSVEKQPGFRYFLHFESVMAGVTPWLNGMRLGQHIGGFLPFEFEISRVLAPGENLLALELDARWLNVPPSGSPAGPPSIDYFLPGGITGSVSLRAVPFVFLRDVHARPVNVLAKPGLELHCHLDACIPRPQTGSLRAVLSRHGRVIASTQQRIELRSPEQQVRLAMTGLRGIELWSPDHPALYDVTVSVETAGFAPHEYRTRVGFREARFDVDGFFLNGERLRLFGLDRHELYPYAGLAAPQRLLRRDAELLRRQYHCNMVRCSHYPQSLAFLDACDELGLMVWEEIPGWQYLGDESWRDLLLRDVSAMVRRDRNRPCVIIWGVRVNESRNDPAFYIRTQTIARRLDDTRPTSGTMTPSSRRTWKTEWHQDVFAYDDYHRAPNGGVGILPPAEGVPYLITEAVGQFNYRTGHGFHATYARGGDIERMETQALYHAQAHSRAAAFPRCAGLLAWCAFDYGSAMNSLNGVKRAGIADFFRLPKPGASFYRAQVSPDVEPVIEPSFYWDPRSAVLASKGAAAAIFSNCERLEVFLDGHRHAVVVPDRTNYPYLLHAPFFVHFDVDPDHLPELRIDGCAGGRRLLSRRFSGDPSGDRLWAAAADRELIADGIDVTQLSFGVVDRYGAPRPAGSGEVRIVLEGPGVVIGDNPFDLAPAGGFGAIWLRTRRGESGTIHAHLRHPTLGQARVEVAVRSRA